MVPYVVASRAVAYLLVPPPRHTTTEQTHGESPPLCLIDDDWGPTDPATGHYGSPACPFETPEWAAFLPAARYDEVRVVPSATVQVNTFRLGDFDTMALARSVSLAQVNTF